MICSWPHRAPNADTPASVTCWQPPRSMLLSLGQQLVTSITHWSVVLLQSRRPRVTRSLVSISNIHTRTRQVSIFICTREARIPRLDSHISDERLWPQPSTAGDLKHWRSVIQYGRSLWLETATSKVERLRTSSQRDKRRMCRSSLRTEKKDGVIIIIIIVSSSSGSTDQSLQHMMLCCRIDKIW